MFQGQAVPVRPQALPTLQLAGQAAVEAARRVARPGRPQPVVVPVTQGPDLMPPQIQAVAAAEEATAYTVEMVALE